MRRLRSHASLLRPVLGVGLIGLIAKLFQVGSGIALAHRFGAGLDTDAYVLAKSLPVGVYLIADSLVYNAFIPLHKKYAREKQASDRYVNSLMAATLCCALLACLLLCWQAPRLLLLLAPGATPALHHLALHLLYLSSISILFALPSSLLKAFNAAQGRYALAALDGLCISAVLVVTILLSPWAGGIYLVALSLSLSFMLLLIIQIFWARRDWPRRAPQWRHPWLGETAALMAPLAALTAIQQVNNWIMNGAASFIETGAISCLNYSYTLAQIPVGVIDLVLFSTLFPVAAALAARNSLQELRRSYLLAGWWIAVLLSPLTVLLLSERATLVQWMLAHGRFDANAAQLTAWTLWGHGLAMIFWALEALGCRFLFALHRHWRYFRIVTIRCLLNMLCCFLLAPRYGLLGISLSFAISFALGALLSSHAVLQRLPASPSQRQVSFKRVGALLFLLLSGAALSCYGAQLALPGSDGLFSILRVGVESLILFALSLGVGLWLEKGSGEG